MKISYCGLVVSLVLATSGCMLGQGEDSPVGASAQSMTTTNAISDNRISLNRISLNRISLNRISLNRISLNRISLNRLDFNSIDALETTPEGRELLLYVARCALEDGDILVAEHDGVEYEFPGLLGLAAPWEFRPLTDSEIRLMSACLLSHVNAYGVSVPISLRVPDLLTVDSAEEERFPVYEGTFFGNVFGEDFLTYACIGDNPEIAAANSPDRALRVCTDPSDDCAVVSLGRCRDICDTRTPGQGWQGCWADGVRYDETISVYLHDPDEDRNNKSCADGTCNLKISDGEDGILDCSESERCRGVCKQGSTCMLDGTGAHSFRAVAKKESLAEVNCHEANQCNALCLSGSSCEIDCKDANDCQSNVRCEGGSECLLDCTGAVECGFAECQGNLQSCDGDIVVCNQPCP